MKKTTQNFVVDAMGFIAMLFLAATGAILYFMLPPGSGGVEGHGAGRPVLLLWGLTRHEWGEIHFWIAVVLLVVLSFHVIQHWKWITSIVKGRETEASGKRLAVGAAALALLVLIALAAVFGPREEIRRGELLERRQASVQQEAVPRLAREGPPQAFEPVSRTGP